MTNEEFQKIVIQKLDKLDALDKLVRGTVLKKLDKLDVLDERYRDLKQEFEGMKIRQDEIYEICSAIEHSNQVGKSELDNHDIRIAKAEGRLKRAGKALFEDSVKVSFV